MRAAEQNENKRQHFGHGVEQKERVRPQPFADESAEQRSQSKADAERGGHETLHLALTLRRRLIKTDFAQ